MYLLKPHSLTEKDLIKECINGNRNCQKQLFDLYAGKMMSVCHRYARHHSEAEDLVQEGFIKVFTHLDKFKFEGSFEGWIRRIMVNNALKYVSKKSFKNESIGVENYPEKPVSPAVHSKLSVDELMKLVDSLPSGYKVIFNLYAIEGFSHKEIAEELNIKESTSRSQLVKARRLLQIKVAELQKIAV